MTWNSKVIWSEGMFLQPQHLQQHDRHVERLIEGRVRPVAGYGWGFASLVIDEAALAMGKIALASAQGIFPDGTPFDFPALDEAPLPLDVAAHARDEAVVLALPLRRPGALDVDVEGRDAARLTRYAATEIEVGDSTLAGVQTATVQIGRLRIALMSERDVTDAYATLAVARVTERRVDNQLVLERTHIAPMLSVRAHGVLSAYAADVHGLLHQRGVTLSSHLAQPGRGGVAEIADFVLLQTVNRFQPLFKHLTEMSMLHPALLYERCLMLAGDLSTFSYESRRPPDYPPYRHDDLQSCFGPVIADLRRSLSMVSEQSAIPIALQDRKYGVRVAVIADAELLRSASFVIAVNAQMPGDLLRQRFPAQVKVGPVERIRDLVNLALPGIVLRAQPVAPRQLPYHAGFTYFELERSGDLWKQLPQSGGLAMHIAGDFPGLELEFWAIRA
jgi:type VI secretion system protein ImpJ